MRFAEIVKGPAGMDPVTMRAEIARELIIRLEMIQLERRLEEEEMIELVKQLYGDPDQKIILENPDAKIDELIKKVRQVITSYSV